MKYYTRPLYIALQTRDETEHIAAMKQWGSAATDYGEYRKSIQNSLPLGFRNLPTFHDGVILEQHLDDNGVLSIKIDASENPWGPRGFFRLTLEGVQEAEGLAEAIGDTWLYEEIHLLGPDAVEYSVLCWKNEFRVIARDAQFVDCGSL